MPITRPWLSKSSMIPGDTSSVPADLIPSGVLTVSSIQSLEILDLLAEPQRMDVAVGRVVAAGADALLCLAVGQFLAPRLEPVGGAPIDRLAQLLEYGLAVADDGQVDVARRVAHLLGVDVDARDLRVGAEARRQGVADHMVRARAEDDDQIGLAERVVAHRQVGQGVVVGDHAAPLPGRVERDAGTMIGRRALPVASTGAARTAIAETTL